MIRFMQTSAAFKKYALTAILVVICVAMAWYLVPSFTGQGLGVTNTNSAVATISGEEVTPEAVRKEAQRELEQQFPRGGAQARSLLPFFAQRAAQQLIEQKVLLVEANRLGLRATDDDVRDFLQHQLGAELFPGGKFVGQTAYEDFAQTRNMSVVQLEQAIKDDIRIQKLQALVTGPANVSDAEVRQAFEKQNTKVKFDYAFIKKEDILKSLHPTEAELQAYYDRNKQNYVNSIPERRQLKYVVIDNARMLAQTQVTQPEIAAYYDQHRDEYRVPEQVNVRHILIKTPLPGPDGKVDPKAVDAAQAKAEDVLKQVKAGGNFAELAKKNSDDPGSAKEGGSLGWIKRGQTVPEFEKSAFSLPKGGTSDLVKTTYGFHIIHVDDKQDAHMKSLAEVKDQIEPILKQQDAARAAQKQADALLNQARAQGSSLEKAAAAEGLQVITTDFVTSHDTLPGIGNDQQFMTAAFAQDKDLPPDLVGLHSGFAIYQVTAIKPPSTPTFSQIRDRVETEFKNERAGQLLTQKTQELSDRGKADHDLKKAAKEAGAQFKTSDFVAPDGQVPEIGSLNGQASVAFTLKPGEISGPIDNGNTGAVLSVLERQAPSDQDFAAKKDQIREGLVQQKQQELFGLFLSSLHDKMQKSGEIKINQKQMDLLTKARSEEE
jgi:peptidyl-prolyl cis-trans isomerase D